jgi:hypothetical protein
MKFSYLALAYLFAGFAAVAKAACDDPVESKLMAGSDIHVGDVTVKLCSDKATIKYSLINPGVCLTAVHAEVFQLDTDHYRAITNKKGNPKSGQFIINEELDCLQVYEDTIAGDDFKDRVADCGKSVNAAAHAVVSTGDFGAFGYARGDAAGVYALDFNKAELADGATLLLDRSRMRGIKSPPDIPGIEHDEFFPNGVAFDPVKGILFYVIDYDRTGASLSELWKYNVFERGDPELISDQLAGRVTGTCRILTTK